jgi:hypothetical protein
MAAASLTHVLSRPFAQGFYPLTKRVRSEILLYVRLNLLSFDNAR